MYGEVTPAESVDLAGGYPQQQFGDLVRLRPRPADGLLAAPGSLRSAVGEQYLDLRPRTDAGPYLRDGDTILIDTEARRLDVELSDEEIRKRLWPNGSRTGRGTSCAKSMTRTRMPNSISRERFRDSSVRSADMRAAR